MPDRRSDGPPTDAQWEAIQEAKRRIRAANAAGKDTAEITQRLADALAKIGAVETPPEIDD